MNVRSKSLVLSLFIIVFLSLSMPKGVHAQLYSIKTNIPALLTTNLNLAFEISVAKHFTLELPVYANPWRYNNRFSAFFGAVQPGARYWAYECFTGPFFGVHTGCGAGDIRFRGIDYRGYFGNVGASLGYAWMLGVRWNLEAEVGAGYYWINFKSKKPGAMWQHHFWQKNIWAPTRLGLNIAYLF